MDTSKNPTLVFETTSGTIEIELMPKIAPKACENIVSLAKKNYYNGVILHRVIKGFMIQGGDPTGTGAGGESIWGENFEDECHHEVTFNKPGLLAMANRGPCTNGSQFFITTAETPWLNNNHTIFGKVVKGYDIVEKIENSETDHMDRPVTKQEIIKAFVK
ncbi:MAG: putative peptidyl-prolyl cis-trans isomerase [Chlamydiia bacterium]|nr:putative peptidyl-prolyl cis-trans isomerase [Chlamydiia bacterium]MCH9615469.1 putative peptidyl-prolyl cis-trans isomerase [Chlamydiia bacterium]MCH9629124.1 putative peptidyl-prolyl cis-trans isomerase [Chlamydiia bacterium]